MHNETLIQRSKNTATLLILLLLFIACSRLIGPDAGSIRGKVLLEGQIDHSGVTVSLYEPAKLDTAIVSLNQKYPKVGVPISQQTEFDHRFAREVVRTRTAKDGSFELKDVGEGEYILVAEKEGYGWRYVFDVSLHVEVQEIDLRILAPETKVSGVLGKDTVWEQDRHYIVTGDVTVPQGVTLMIEPGAWVRFDGYYKLKVEGTLKAEGKPNHMITFTSQLPQGTWNRIEFDGADDGGVLIWSRIEWANRGVYCVRSSPVVRKSMVRYCVFGVVANSFSDPWIEGNVILGCGVGLWIEVNSDPVIYSNVIMRNEDTGILAKISSSPRIENNWLCWNPIGMSVSYGSSPVIVHNVIVDGQDGVQIIKDSHVTLSENVVGRQSSMAFLFESFSHPPDLHRNNILDNSGWYVYLDWRMTDVDARNNWWGTVDKRVIASKIRDGSDLPPNSEETLGLVEYEPFEVEPLREAGLTTAASDEEQQ